MPKSKSAHHSKKQMKVKEEDKDEIPFLEVFMTYKQIQEATHESTISWSTRYHLVRLPWRWFWPTKFCCIQSWRFVHVPSGPFCILFWFISRVMVQPQVGGSYWHAKIIELCSNGQSDNLMVTDVFSYISWYLFIDDQQVFAFVHVKMEYCEMLFQLETEHSNKELYRIITQRLSLISTLIYSNISFYPSPQT